MSTNIYENFRKPDAYKNINHGVPICGLEFQPEYIPKYIPVEKVETTQLWSLSTLTKHFKGLLKQ